MRKCSVLVLTRPLTTIAVLSFAFRFFDTDTACGFLRETSMTAAGEMPPKIVMVMPYAVGMMPFAVWPFRERPKFHCVCKVKLASSINTQFRVKSNSGVFPFFYLLFRSFITLSLFFADGNFWCFFRVIPHVCTKYL